MSCTLYKNFLRVLHSIITIIYQNAFGTEQNPIPFRGTITFSHICYSCHCKGNKAKASTNQVSLFSRAYCIFCFFLFLSFSLYKGSVEKPSTQSTVLLSPQCQYGHRSKWQIEINHNLLFPSLALRLAFIGFNSDMPFNDWILHAQLLKNCALGH